MSTEDWTDSGKPKPYPDIVPMTLGSAYATAWWAVDQHISRARTCLVVARLRPDKTDARVRAGLENMKMAMWLMGQAS